MIDLINSKYRKYVIIFIWFIAVLKLSAQGNEPVQKQEGIVTYISSQNVYVQFTDTNPTEVGDTLFIERNNTILPAVLVKYISSRSCAGSKLQIVELKKSDIIFSKPKKETPQNKRELVQAENERNIAQPVSEMPVRKKISQKNLYGRISIQSNTNLANTSSRDNYQRWRYTFSLNADTISGSPFSISSYLYFSYNVRDWDAVKSNLGRALKIYDLAISYKFGNQNKIWLGRHLNPKISNIGSIDGIQYQHQMGNYYAGGIIGSHPDFSDYGYNFKMFEYGFYFGRADTFASSQMENTLAFFNQTNNYRTDRRYIYFQHSNNIIKGITFFASTEADIYKKISGTVKNEASLTSLFLSLYLRPARFLSLSFSYDARRNVVYYETYKSYIDSLFTNEMRQGLRSSVYLRPFNNVSISFSGGYRYQKNDIKPARNFNANFYYANIPFLNLNGTANYTKLISSYTDGTITGLRLSKYINALDLNLSAGYRQIKYQFNYNIDPVIQNSVSADASFQLPLNLFLGISYEGVFEKRNSYGRFFIDLTKRF